MLFSSTFSGLREGTQGAIDPRGAIDIIQGGGKYNNPILH